MISASREVLLLMITGGYHADSRRYSRVLRFSADTEDRGKKHMNTNISILGRAMARICDLCPVCRYARYRQQGAVFDFVKKVEQAHCPFCKAYERLHGKKAHEKKG